MERAATATATDGRTGEREGRERASERGGGSGEEEVLDLHRLGAPSERLPSKGEPGAQRAQSQVECARNQFLGESRQSLSFAHLSIAPFESPNLQGRFGTADVSLAKMR